MECYLWQSVVSYVHAYEVGLTIWLHCVLTSSCKLVLFHVFHHLHKNILSIFLVEKVSWFSIKEIQFGANSEINYNVLQMLEVTLGQQGNSGGRGRKKIEKGD